MNRGLTTRVLWTVAIWEVVVIGLIALGVGYVFGGHYLYVAPPVGLALEFDQVAYEAAYEQALGERRKLVCAGVEGRLPNRAEIREQLSCLTGFSQGVEFESRWGR
jgi:hypothetical protein